MSSLTGMFVGMHALAAQVLNTPELELAPEEGQSFMDAASRVARHYSVTTTQRTLDWIAFAGVAATIYGTRAAVIMKRKREERRPERPPENPFGTVMSFPHGGD